MEQPPIYPMIGLMSGTSCDGLDIVAVTFEETSSAWNYVIHAAETSAFPTTMGKKLSTCHLLCAADLAILDVDFGKWIGEEVAAFCNKNNFSPLAIASHGHTVFHQPENSLSMQIGNGWSIYAASGVPVVNDFRSLDVRLGGQGAPLVPIGDKLLFSEYDFCLNLGGIANISYQADGRQVAFDISPFNLLLNHFANKLGHPFDRDGRLAQAGEVHNLLLKQLNELPYYQIQGAKSLGREQIDRDFLPLLTNSGIGDPDLLATLSAHMAYQVAASIKNGTQENGKLLCTGGGAYNAFFIQQLREKTKGLVEITVPSAHLVEFKEALIFALLGVLRLTGRPNCLASVTGASKDSCGGTLFGLIS
jgi:anhydro-N-acetylmuramic acid kinase